MKRYALAALGIAVASIAFVAVAEWRSPAAFDVNAWDPELVRKISIGPAYLSADMELGIAPPHAPDSEETAKELDFLVELQANRTADDTEQIRAEVGDFSPLFLVRAGIDPKEKPRTMELVQAAYREAGYFILREKWKYQRARPYDVDSRLDPVIPPLRHASYPSGHGGQSRIIALTLSELDPSRRDLWLGYAESVGKNREIAGVHFPSDTRAGIAAADAVFAELMRNPLFLEDVARVKAAEWPAN